MKRVRELLLSINLLAWVNKYILKITNLVVVPNFNFDICNILFCFCFSGPATYNHTDEISNDPSSNISSINWILENAGQKMK